jgi:hypothetical protein
MPPKQGKKTKKDMEIEELVSKAQEDLDESSGNYLVFN